MNVYESQLIFGKKLQNGCNPLTLRDMQHFGKVLKRLIAERRLDQEAFAKEAGISADTLYRNIRSPMPIGRAVTYTFIADALGLSTPELDRLWMDKPAAAADASQKEKGMDITNMRVIATLTLEECDVLIAAVAGRRRQLRAAQNAAPPSPARAGRRSA